MMITILATFLMMLAYFLVLYGAVGFIQDKRFFGSAPKENLAATGGLSGRAADHGACAGGGVLLGGGPCLRVSCTDETAGSSCVL